MKHIFFNLLLILFFSTRLFAQSEYRFWSVKLGIVQNIADPMPTLSPNKFLRMDGNEFPLTPNQNFFNYRASISAEALYHVDMKNEKIGFAGGIEYARYGVAQNYTSSNNQELTETHHIQAVGMPFFAKISSELYNKQFYMMIGAQMNFNIGHSVNERVSWLNNSQTIKRDNAELSAVNLLFFTGLNFKIFNIKVSYLPGTFFNPEYEYTNEYGTFKPNEYVQSGHFMLTAGLNIPLSEWLTLNNWKAEQLRRRFKYSKYAY